MTINPEELAFVNLQLAAMLKRGIPLEGAIRQLAESMKQGRLKTELQVLTDDLVRGIPLKEAVGRRRLPDLYIRILEVGAQSNDLPAILNIETRKARLEWIPRGQCTGGHVAREGNLP